MPGVTQKTFIMCIDSQPLSIGTVELVDDSDSQSENRPARRSPNDVQRDENQTGGNALWQSVLTVATELALRLLSDLQDAVKNTIFNRAVGKQQKAS